MIESALIGLRTRRALLVALVLAAGCVALSAQPDGPGPGGPPPFDMQSQQSRGPGAARELKQLTRLLALTDDQQTQVKAILADEYQQIDSLYKQSRPAADNNTAGGPPSMEAMNAMRDTVKTIRRATYEKIAALLAPDQQAKFATWRQKQEKAADRQNDDMPFPPDGGGPPPGGGPGGGGPPGV